MTNTIDGAKKGGLTRRKKYGVDHYAKIGAKGGAASSSRPFKDPAMARRAALIGWQKRRATAAAKLKEEQENDSN